MSKSEIQVLDFEKICRLCLLEKRSMSAIFSKKKSDKKVPLPVRIMSCASLELYEGDGLPASICNKCLMSVNQSYAFREQCEQADTTLRQYAQRLNEANEEASTNPYTVIKEFFEKFNLSNKDGTLSINVFCEEIDQIKSDEGSLAIKKDQPSLVSEESNISKGNKRENVENDLLKRLSLNSGITITKKSSNLSKAATKSPKDHNEWNLLKRFANNEKVKREIQKLKENAVKNSKDSAKIVRKLSVNDKMALENQFEIQEAKKKGFTTAQFFEEYAEGVDEAKVPRNSNKDDRVYCKVCKIFIGRPYFYNHVKYVHKKVRDHLCQDCGYRAQTGHILRQHIESQHSGTVLPCSQCSMTFTCAKRLKYHVNKHHSGKPVERKHVCQYCGKAFTTPHYLKNHIRVHTQETPYICQFCQRKFKFKWACKTHERLHTGVKPYKCTYCGEAFTQNCVRKNHEYRFHGNEEFNPKNRIPKQGNRREKRGRKSGNAAVVQPLDLVEVVTGNSADCLEKVDGT